MKAILKDIHGWGGEDFARDPSTGPIYIWVRAMVGLEGQKGEESFDFMVCTPEGLAEQVKGQPPLSGRHHIIVERFDIAEITKFIQNICDSATGDSWQEIATKIGRYGRWEFEDYKE